MNVETVSAFSLASHARLDSKYFLSPGIQAADRIAQAKARGILCVPLGGPNGIGRVWQPNRFTKVEAAEREEKSPYLAPYDVFEYMPRATEFLSAKRSKGFQSCLLKRGMLLQSCSGRNLGPAVFVDSYLERFVIGSDMIRIEIEDDDLRSYALAYLQSETGQQLLTQGKTGSVIDHVSKKHIERLEIPLLEHHVRAVVISKMREAIRLREEARLKLDTALLEYEESLPKVHRQAPEKTGWTVKAKNLKGRLDAASYDPLVTSVRKRLTSIGGVTVGSVATVLKPPSRYKRFYVDRGYGEPIVSGGQLLQARPINLRYISLRSFKNHEPYELRKGWLAYQADGRAEEALGLPVMITSDRDGWLANDHVGRIVKNSDVDLGWFFLAVKSWVAQIQIKSFASGSVVDSTFPSDMESVILPPPRNCEGIQAMWERFADAQRLEDEAVSLVEQSLGGSGSGHDFPVKLAKPLSPLELEFHRLVVEWRWDTQHTSSVKRMVSHPSYKRITELGCDVLPLLFRELNAHGDHWLVALNEITGQDPAPEGSSFTEAVEAWLAWGREKGYLTRSDHRT